MFKKIKDKSYTLLRWSEKWTQTDMVYLAKGGFWLTSSQFISSLVSFLLAIAFANLLPKETYGTYRYILSIAGLITISSLSGINTSFIQAIAKGEKVSFRLATIIKFKWGLIGMILGIITASYYLWQGNTILGYGLLVVSLLAPLIESLTLYSSKLNGTKDFQKISIYRTASQLINLIVIFLALYLSDNLLLILFCLYFSQLCIRSFFSWKTRDHEEETSLTDNKKMLSLGKHLSFMNVIGQIIMQADKILLWHFLGAAPLAIYAFAQAPVTHIQTAITPLKTLSYPKIANTNKEELKKHLPKKMFKLFLILIIIVIAYIIFAPLLFKIFFPEYIEAVNYSRLYSLIILFFPQKMMSLSLTAQAQTKALYVISILNPIVKIILLAILLPLFGIWGAIISLIIPYAVNTITLTYYFKKM